MADPYVGEIRMFAGNFAPHSWAFCDGQLLAISQYDALFSLFGTIYGGDGRTTFGLPDLRGRIPIHQGTGPGLSPRPLATKAGTETVTLTTNELPGHTHDFSASTADADESTPLGRVLSQGGGNMGYLKENSSAARVSFSADSLTNTGSSIAHTNLQPTICVHFIVALFGIYPQQN